MKNFTVVFARKYLYFFFLFQSQLYSSGCEAPKPKKHREKIDYIKQIPGMSDSIPVKIIQKGEVLISYSDCYTCHKQATRSVGPAFTDIAKRYPVNNVYIETLARKVISGGSGNWGTAAMDPHPKLSLKDAKTMVSYVLSLKEFPGN